MVDFTTWMEIGLEQCAPSGPGTGEARKRVFAGLVDGWNDQKDTIRGMTESEVRNQLVCP